MKAILFFAVMFTTAFSSGLRANTVSFSEVLAAQEVITISPIEIDGLPVVGLNLAASKICTTAGFELVRSFKVSRTPVGPVREAFRFEESVLKKVKVGGSLAILQEVVCSR